MEVVMEIQSTAPNQGLAPIDEFSGIPGDQTPTSSTPLENPVDSGDTATFSPEAMAMAGMSEEGAEAPQMMLFGVQSLSSGPSDPFDPVTFTATTASAKLGFDTVGFNSSNGAVTWNGKLLNLSGIGDAKTEDLIFQKEGTGINVYNGANSFRLNFDGTQVKNPDGSLSPASGPLDASKAALYINNVASSVTGGTGNDVLINRKEGASIAGGTGNDKIFNFAKTVGTLDGGAGENSIYTVGLTSGTVDTGSTSTEDAYVRVLGNMSGGTIKVGLGDNTIDASGASLSGVTITDGGAAAKSTDLVATSISGGSVTLLGDKAGVKVTTLDSDITFGDGTNSLIADVAKNKTITSTGTASYQVRVLDGATIDSSGATTGDTEIIVTGSANKTNFKLGGGENQINATGKTLTSITVTDLAGASTSILAGSITGTDTDKSNITLLGDAAGGNSVEVTGAINYSTINTGAGEGSLKAGSIANSAIIMDQAGTNTQNIFVKGTVSNTDITTGGGDDTVTINGNLSSAAGTNTINLGAGADEMQVKGATSGYGINMGADDNTLTLGSTVKGVTYTGTAGTDDVIIRGAVASSTFNLGDGTNSFIAQSTLGTNQTLTNVNINASGTTAADATSVTAGAYRAGNGVASAMTNNITLGDGANVVTLKSISGLLGSTLNMSLGAATGANVQNLTVKGAVSNLTLTTGNAADAVNILSSVKNSTFNLNNGANNFRAASASGVGQLLTNVNINATGATAADATTITAGAFKAGNGVDATPNKIQLGDGANSVTLGSISGVKGATLDIILGAAAGTAAQSLTVKGNMASTNVTGGAGADTISVTGAVSKSTMTTDAGNNTITVGKTVNGLTYTGAAGNDTITINGATSNSSFALGDGVSNVTVASAAGVGQNMTNVGITSGAGNVTLKGGAYKVGADFNSITLGDGAHDVTLKSVTGTATQAANITLADGIAKDQKLTIESTANNFKYTGADGKEDVLVKGTVSNSAIDLGNGVNNFTAARADSGGLFTIGQTLTNVKIDGGTGDNTIYAGAYKAGATNNSITLGDGVNKVTLSSVTGYNATTRALMNLGLAAGTAANNQELLVKGAVNGMDYTGAIGVDKVTVNGAISNADFDLGDGDNTLEASKLDSTSTKRGQILTNVNISADGGDNTLTYGIFKPGTAGNTIELGLGSTNGHTINILA